MQESNEKAMNIREEEYGIKGYIIPKHAYYD
jgi:hypothetical protein